MDFMKLKATLTLDKSEYEKGLDSAEKSTSKWSKVGKVAKGVGVAAAAVTTATIAAGGAFVKATGQVAEYGDTIDKESQKLGISAQAYQEWDAILQHTGGSINSLKPAMKTLAKEAINNSDAFQKLGISQEEVANSSKEEIFEKTISALQKMPEGMERTRLATQLLGRSSVELGALLNTSSEDTEKMRQRVHELGGVMSDDAVKASARYQDSLQDMMTALGGVKRNLVGSFLPSIADVMDGLGNLFAGDNKKGLGQIKDGVSNFIQNMMDAVPRVIEVASTIVSALGQAIIENLPRLLETGIQAIAQIAKGIGEGAPNLVPSIVETVLTMVDTLLDNIDLLVDAALQLALGLAEGLINAIPVIIEKLPEIIVAIVTALVKAAPKIAQAGVKLLGSLIKNLPKIIGSIVTAIPKIVVAMTKKFISAAPKFVKVGADLIAGIGRGILSGASRVVQACINTARRILNGFKKALGIASPSKIMAQYGKFMDEGLAMGIMANVDLAKNAMDSLADAVSVPMDVGVGMDQTMIDVLNTPDDAVTSVNGSSNGNNGNMTVILELDRMQLARTVFRLNNEESQRVGLNLAGGMA